MQEIRLPLPGRDLSYRLVIEPGLRRRSGTPAHPLPVPPPGGGDLGPPGGPPPRRRSAGLSARGRLCPRAPDHASRGAGQDLGRGAAPGQGTPGPGRPPGNPDHRPGRRRGGGCSPAFWPPSSCGGCPSSRCPPPCWPWWTPPSAARPPSICRKGKTSWAPFTSPAWWSSTLIFCAPCPGPSGSTAWPKCSRPGLSGTGTCWCGLTPPETRVFADEAELTETIYRAAAIKVQVVSQDEREGDLRRILNFGHTLGHGLEQASRFRLAHGRAVAWGMVAALTLSERLAGLDPAEAEWGRRLIRDFGFLRSLPELNPEAVMAAFAWTRSARKPACPLSCCLAWARP